MKSFKEFLNEDAVKAAEAWRKWMAENPQDFKKGGRFYEKGGTEKTSAAAKNFMKTYMKTGRPPEGFEFKTTKVSGSDVGFGGKTKKEPPKAQPEPPKAQPEQPKAQTRAQQPSPKVRPKLRSRLGRVGNLALSGLSAVDAIDSASRGEYGDALTSGLLAAQGSRRLSRAAPRAGRTAVQKIATRLGRPVLGKAAARFVPGLSTAYGIARGTQAAMRGDQLGAALGYGSAIPVVGGAFAAADIARDVMPQKWKNKIASSIGYRKTSDAAAQTKKDIEKLKNRPRTSPKQMLSTMDTRSSRNVASKLGTYGATQGSAIVGTGGKTTFDTKNNKITTGGKTASLPSTQILPGGRVGDLAYRNGKPVYLARASVASRNNNLFARLSRATGIGGQRQRDAAAAQRERNQAISNTQKYRRDLGISGSGASYNPPKTGQSARSAQAYAASKGKYYSSTTGKTYANYAAALKDPAVRKATSKT